MKPLIGQSCRSALLLFAVAAATSIAATASATTYYVDSAGGNDGNSGTTSALPWQTLGKVNSITFSPGDRILFKSGDIWTGQLAPQGSGAAGSPIQIDSYGTGSKPVINGGGVLGGTVQLYNQEYWEIRDLEITNATTASGNYNGIYVEEDDVGVVHHIVIEDNEIHDVHNVQGDTTRIGPILLNIGGNTTPTYFDYVYVNNNIIHDSGFRAFFLLSVWHNRTLDPNYVGSTTGAGAWTPSINIIYSNNTIYNMQGDSGNIHEADSPLIEHNVIHDSNITGGTGYWVFDTDHAIFQFNETYNGTPGSSDGYAFDNDYYQDGTIFQYNYGHDNPGGFIELDADMSKDGYSTINSIVRYNIGQNNRQNTVLVSGGVASAMIYNNTFYDALNIGKYAVKFASWNGWPKSTTFENNIWDTDNSLDFYQGSATGTVYDYNEYYGTITNLPSDAHASTANPRFVSKGSGSSGIGSVGGYQLVSGSPALGSGVHIGSNGARDFWGYGVPGSGSPNRGAYNGAGLSWTYSDDAGGLVAYSGSDWQQMGAAQDYDGTMTQGGTAGDTVSSTFTGTAIGVAVREGPYGGLVDVYLDGQKVLSGFDTYSASRMYQQLIYQNANLAPGNHTIELYATGTKDSASSGTEAMFDYFECINPPTAWTLVDAGSWLISYSSDGGTTANSPGDWQLYNRPLDDAATMMQSDVAGDTATLTFTGTAAGVYLQKGPYCGYIDVYLDGNEVLANYDGYNSTTAYHQLVYSTTGLSPGTHTIQLYITGNKDGSASQAQGMLDSFEYY